VERRRREEEERKKLIEVRETNLKSRRRHRKNLEVGVILKRIKSHHDNGFGLVW